MRTSGRANRREYGAIEAFRTVELMKGGGSARSKSAQRLATLTDRKARGVTHSRKDPEGIGSDVPQVCNAAKRAGERANLKVELVGRGTERGRPFWRD